MRRPAGRHPGKKIPSRPKKMPFRGGQSARAGVRKSRHKNYVLPVFWRIGRVGYDLRGRFLYGPLFGRLRWLRDRFLFCILWPMPSLLPQIGALGKIRMVTRQKRSGLVGCRGFPAGLRVLQPVGSLQPMWDIFDTIPTRARRARIVRCCDAAMLRTRGSARSVKSRFREICMRAGG